MSAVQVVSIVLAVMLASTRILRATEPLWRLLPQKWRTAPPIALIVLGTVGSLLTGDQSVDAVAEQIVAAITAILALYAPGMAAHGGAAALVLFLLVGAAPGCSLVKPEGPVYPCPEVGVCAKVTWASLVVTYVCAKTTAELQVAERELRATGRIRQLERVPATEPRQ